MSPTLVTTLTLISGISWTIVYIELIRRGFLDRTYGMPLFALAFNIAWEFMYALSTPVVKGLFFNLCESNRCWQGYTCT